MPAMPFSPCTDPNNCTDSSVKMLTDIFGPIIETLSKGLDPDTALASSNVLATMFGVFNSGLLVIASLLVSYIAVMGTMNTANDGVAMGKNWSSLWTPARLVAGGSVLLPSSSGYSFIQIIVFLFALWGVGFANMVYNAGFAMGIFSPNGVVPNIVRAGDYYGVRSFAENYFKTAYCRHAATVIYTSPVGAPDFNNNTSDRVDVTENSSKLVMRYALRDWNEITNLGGGLPVCGTVSIEVPKYRPGSEYISRGLSQEEATEAALDQIRVLVGAAKVGAVQNMMADLQAWASRMPTSTTAVDDWVRVDPNRFNEIVTAAENEIANSMSLAMTSTGSPQVTQGLTLLKNSFTSTGWADAGGWMQRVGVIREQTRGVISGQFGNVEAPNLTSLPKDARYRELDSVLNASTSAILASATRSAEKNGKPQDSVQLAESIGGIAPASKDDIDPAKMRDMFESKGGTFLNSMTGTAVSIVLGVDSGKTWLCGTAGDMGGSINRMKCLGDYLAAMGVVVSTMDITLKGAAFVLAGSAGTLDTPYRAALGWQNVVTEIIGPFLAKIKMYIDTLAFYFGVFLPAYPYAIFMIVVAGWVLGVLQAVVAAPLWAVMHMQPDRTFIGSQGQGYLLLLQVFVRPALAILGLFAAVTIADPVIHYIAKGFFAMSGALTASTGFVGAIAQFYTFMWWLIVFAFVLLPVIYMIFGLPQTLPGEVLSWISVRIGSFGESNAIGEVRGGAKESLAMNRIGAGSNKQKNQKPGGSGPGGNGGDDGSKAALTGGGQSKQEVLNAGDQGAVGNNNQPPTVAENQLEAGDGTKPDVAGVDHPPVEKENDNPTDQPATDGRPSGVEPTPPGDPKKNNLGKQKGEPPAGGVQAGTNPAGDDQVAAKDDLPDGSLTNGQGAVGGAQDDQRQPYQPGPRRTATERIGHSIGAYLAGLASFGSHEKAAALAKTALMKTPSAVTAQAAAMRAALDAADATGVNNPSANGADANVPANPDTLAGSAPNGSAAGQDVISGSTQPPEPLAGSYEEALNSGDFMQASDQQTLADSGNQIAGVNNPDTLAGSTPNGSAAGQDVISGSTKPPEPLAGSYEEALDSGAFMQASDQPASGMLPGNPTAMGKTTTGGVVTGGGAAPLDSTALPENESGPPPGGGINGDLIQKRGLDDPETFQN